MRSPEPGSVGGGPRRDAWPGGAPAYGRWPTNGGEPGGDARDVADLARRLLRRLDGHEAVLERAADLATYADDRARLGELRDTARRMRRDGEALLLLTGDDPGGRNGAPRAVPAVLGDALALVDEPARAVLRAAPPASVVAPAAVELRHLVAQLVDEAAAASPDARVEVAARLNPDGSLAVEVVAARGFDPDAPRRPVPGVSRLAERLARRSPGGIRLERPLLDATEGLVATLHCPPALVVGGTAPDPWVRSRPIDPLSGPLQRRSSGPLSGPLPVSTLPAPGDALLGTETSVLLATGPRRPRGGDDELFGPLPSTVDTASTPIFEAVASAWFRDDERGPAVEEWSSPGDREWRAAAAAATRAEVPTTMANGLPRRSPGDRLVPPPRESRAAAPDERVPERVRDRLATYQRGLRQGRHRAAEPGAAPEAQAWSAEGW